MNNKLNMALVMCLMMSSCQTYTAISKEVPDQYIEIVQDGSSVDVEAYLKSSGTKYTCKELFFGNNSVKNRRACYVKAPEESRLNTLGVKVHDAPEALLADTGNAILVVGKVAINMYLLMLNSP